MERMSSFASEIGVRGFDTGDRAAPGASMGPVEAMSDPPGGGVLDYRRTGPTVARMLVGARLRRLREAAGVSIGDAGYAIRGSHSKISRLELGRTGFKSRDVADLLTLYGVTGEDERATLIALARQANAPGWWHPYGDVVPGWFVAYLGLEQGAEVIRSYEVQFVPGLLQTAGYAREVIALGHPDAPPEEIDRRVEVRTRRQDVLARPNAPRLWALIDEAALRRPIGGPATMRAQLRHLIEICEHPGVTIQVMPFSAGGHAAAGTPITILRFGEVELADVVYLEQLTSAIYLDKPADSEYYWHVMNHLAMQAQPAGATHAILRGLLDQV
jgi:transcriptional regulator with XRE-family HTH domain